MDFFEITRKKRGTKYSMVQSHYHDFYELYYLITGRCRMFVGHSLYYVEAGDLLLLSPGVIHRATYPEENETVRIAIFFDGGFLKPLAKVWGEEEMRRAFEGQLLRIPIPVRPQVELLFDKIEEESGRGEAVSMFLARNHCYEMLVTAGRYGIRQKRGAEGAAEEAVQKAARYISRNYEKPLSLEEMAGMVYMTPTYFSRRFKQVTGFGFKEYLVYTRIAQAEKLLVHTSLPVTDIAAACGFEDSNYFGDCFKKRRGVSPREYRKRIGITPQI